MKHIVVILLQVILFVNIYSLASAETILSDDDTDCLAVTKIARNDIDFTWDRACFDDTSFLVKVEVNAKTDCNKTIPCDGEGLCTTSIRDMGCGSFIDPCDDVTLEVIGVDSNITEPLSTNVAPFLTTDDWKLENSAINKEDDTILDASWGPPEDPYSSYVRCAKKTHVAVTCTGQNDDNSVISNITDLSKPGEAQLDISNCDSTGEYITLTVTYMADDILTDTKRSTEIKNPNYIPVTTSETPATTSTSDISYTTNNGTRTTPDKRDNKLSPGAIAGIVIGSLVGVALIGVFAYSYSQKKLFFK